jgi:hypothetical protein
MGTEPSQRSLPLLTIARKSLKFHPAGAAALGGGYVCNTGLSSRLFKPFVMRDDL